MNYPSTPRPVLVGVWRGNYNVAVISVTDEKFLVELQRWIAEQKDYELTERKKHSLGLSTRAAYSKRAARGLVYTESVQFVNWQLPRLSGARGPV
jgi:hypothetical protein